MATFEQYKKKDGTKAWMFKAYLGKDIVTRKDVRTTRRGFNSKRQAQDELNKLMVEFKNNNNVLKNNDVTYKECYDLWLESYRLNVKESTLNKTTNIFEKTIFKKLKNQRISELTPRYCQKCANEWSEKYVSFDRIIFYASTVIEHSFKLDMIDSNPFSKIIMPKPKKEKKEFKNFFTKQELKMILDYTRQDKATHAQIRIMAYSGIRLGECNALCWSDIDLTERTIDINKTTSLGFNNKILVQSPKTINSYRKLTIDAATIEILKKWKYQQEALLAGLGMKVKLDSEQLVFPKIDNTHQGSGQLAYQLSKMCNELKINHRTPHALRHTHASLLFESGASMKEIQERLGHSNASFTSDIYTHLSQMKKEDTVNKLIKYLNT